MNKKKNIILIVIIVLIIINSNYVLIFANDDAENLIFKKALTSYEKENYEEAVINFRKLININSSNSEYYVYLLTLYQSLQNPKAILEYVRLAKEHHPDLPKLFYFEAIAYKILKKNNEAIKSIKQAITLAPHEIDNMLLLIEIYIEINDIKNAEKILNELQILYPNKPEYKEIRIKLYQKKGDYNKVFQLYLENLKNNNKPHYMYIQIGYNEYLQKHYNLARDYYLKAQTSDNKNIVAVAKYYLVHLYLKQRKFNIALYILRQMKNDKANIDEFSDQIGYYLYNFGDYSRTLIFYNRTITGNIKKKLFKNQIIQDLGLCYLMLKDYNKALYYFKMLIKLGYRSSTLYINTGWCLHKLKKDRDATVIYENILTDYPKDKILLCNYALSLAYIFEFKKALTILNKLTQTKEKVFAHLYISATLSLAGKKQEALNYLEIALNENNDEIKLKDDILEETAFYELIQEKKFQEIIKKHFETR